MFWTIVPGEVDAQVFDAAGNPLFGTDYVAQLYGGPTQDSLSPARYWSIDQTMPPTPFTHVNVFGEVGYIHEMTWAGIRGVPGPGFAWLQVRAWDARLGGTYEEVVARGIGGYGESNLILALTGDPNSAVPPGRLIGLESFSLLPVVPEPSGPLLMFLGGLTLLALGYGRRK